MIIGIHQPNYLPYLGFFEKMKQSDIFVIYDDAKFNKSDFHHRNKIRIFSGCKWLTVPVEKKQIPINQIIIKNEAATWKGTKWSEDHFNNIKNNYNKTQCYSDYEDDIKNIYEKRYTKLVDLNMNLINFLRKAFDINTEIRLSSNFKFASKSTERLVEIVEDLGGDTYLSGVKGRDYLDLSMFEKKGIKVKFQNYKNCIYKQQFEGFIPNIAAIDALLNIGKFPSSSD